LDLPCLSGVWVRQWGLLIRPELRAVLCPEMPLTSPAPTILARLAVKAVLLLCEFYSLLNKASHERERADPKGEADEGGCEREARVGGACRVCHTNPVESADIWIYPTFGVTGAVHAMRSPDFVDCWSKCKPNPPFALYSHGINVSACVRLRVCVCPPVCACPQIAH